MTKTPKEKGEEKQRLSDWINGTLNNIIKDAVDFNTKRTFNMNLIPLRARELRKLKREIEKVVN